MNAQIGKLSITADAQHPNKMQFKGVLVRIDEASTKPPGGAQGHKIYIPADVAKRRLSTLIGMGLNYSPDLDSHAQRRKVGVIEKAWIDGQDVCVSGVIWKHDFPEAEKDLKQPGLGMSMELVDVAVENPNANIWTLKDFHFSGATILYRNAAAYYRTQAIAAKADQRSRPMAKVMKKAPEKKPSTTELIATIAAAAAAKVVADVVGASNKTIAVLLSRQTKSIGELAAAQTVLTKRVAMIDTSAADEDGEIDAGDELEADGEDVDAGFTKKEDDPEDQADGGDDEDSEVEAGTEDGDIEVGDLEKLATAEGVERPGHKNEDVANKGSKTTPEDKVGPTVSAKAFRALKAQVDALTKTLEASKQSEKKLATKLEVQEKQLAAASDRTARRSLSPEAAGLLAKAHINAADLFATGQKLTVAELDAVLASFNQEQGNRMSITDRMMLKNQFTAAGLLEDGVVNRATN